MCTYIGAFLRPDGYNGDKAVSYVVREPSGRLLAVHTFGWHTVWEEDLIRREKL